jgi:hypothetical protein
MLYLGKTNTGVILFDTISKLKLRINSNKMNDITIMFDTRNCENNLDDGNNWKMIRVSIMKEHNENIYNLFNNLFANFSKLIDITEKDHIIRTNNMPNEMSLRRDDLQGIILLFPIDNAHIDKSHFLSLDKKEEGNIYLSYSTDKYKPHNVKLRLFNSRFNEVANLYNEFFLGLYELASLSYEEAESFYDKKINGYSLINRH